MPELPEFNPPETLSAEDIVGNCPLVVLRAQGYVFTGWLVEVTDTDAYLARNFPQERGGSQLDYKWQVRLDTIDEVTVMQEQPPSAEAGNRYRRRSGVLG